MPFDDEHPFERVDQTTKLFIVLNFDYSPLDDQTFLEQVKDFFSSYGQIDEFRYDSAKHFRYIFLRFDDPGEQKKTVGSLVLFDLVVQIRSIESFWTNRIFIVIRNST